VLKLSTYADFINENEQAAPKVVQRHGRCPYAPQRSKVGWLWNLLEQVVDAFHDRIAKTSGNMWTSVSGTAFQIEDLMASRKRRCAYLVGYRHSLAVSALFALVLTRVEQSILGKDADIGPLVPFAAIVTHDFPVTAQPPASQHVLVVWTHFLSITYAYTEDIPRNQHWPLNNAGFDDRIGWQPGCCQTRRCFGGKVSHRVQARLTYSSLVFINA
jgi:hypothetical protein